MLIDLTATRTLGDLIVLSRANRSTLSIRTSTTCSQVGFVPRRPEAGQASIQDRVVLEQITKWMEAGRVFE